MHHRQSGFEDSRQSAISTNKLFLVLQKHGQPIFKLLTSSAIYRYQGTLFFSQALLTLSVYKDQFQNVAIIIRVVQHIYHQIRSRKI